MNISATPETVRAVTEVFKLAGILDDRVAHPDKARVIAWAEQVQRHNFTEPDLLDGLQAFYDSPSERAIQVSDLIHHAQTVRRARHSRESDQRHKVIAEAGDRKTADDLASIASVFVSGSVPRTARLDAAETALQTCVDKRTAIEAMREFFAAKAEARGRFGHSPRVDRDLVARQRAAAPPVTLTDREP